jgi:hypothetical protein
LEKREFYTTGQLSATAPLEEYEERGVCASRPTLRDEMTLRMEGNEKLNDILGISIN